METFRLFEALTSSAPVSRRTFATTVAGGGAALAAVASLEKLAGSGIPWFGRASVVSLSTGGHPAAMPSAAISSAGTLSIVRGSVSVVLPSDVLDRFAVVERVVGQGNGSAQRFTGVALIDLLSAVGAGTGVRVRVTSATTVGSSTVILTPAQASAPSSLVATRINGRLLTTASGAPARLISGTSPAATGRLVRMEVLG